MCAGGLQDQAECEISGAATNTDVPGRKMGSGGERVTAKGVERRALHCMCLCVV